MREILTGIVLSLFLLQAAAANDDQEATSRGEKALSVFNVVTFPNSACGASNGYNGTCYTSSECEAKGGTASGTCASSFGVCCVFSISCGASSSANNSYAIISSYSTSSDADPCTYTFCKTNNDVCKLRIDFDTMVLTAPVTYAANPTAASTYLHGAYIGDCTTDSLTVSNPGGAVPPTVCGYNTGQHMWVPASDSCNQINIDIDTGSTSTTRKWQIKVTQYECGNMMMPEQDCLQYHTDSEGTIASFNWDTSATTIATSQTHLSNQYYDICIRRARGYCSVCYSPYITSTTIQSSYGVGGSSLDPAQTASVGSVCTGITTFSSTEGSQVAYGDYLEIAALQNSPATSTDINGVSRICGNFWSASSTATAHTTACSYATPFKVGVHFDTDEVVFSPVTTASALTHSENAPTSSGSGIGYTGFYLNYWQATC